MSLPKFNLDEYARLVGRLKEVGYLILPVSSMRDKPTGKVLFLQHDVDLHLRHQQEIAAVDQYFGAGSTFFVRVTGHYNPFFAPNRKVISELLDYGREIGLHYDLHDIGGETDMLAQLYLLGQLIGKDVESFSMHEPSLGNKDSYLDHPDFKTMVNPQHYKNDLMYISDSCRAWRDENILKVLSEDGPERVLLNLHGELWLDDTVKDRHEYLRYVSMPNAMHFTEEYFEDHMARLWRMHPAARWAEGGRW